MTQRSKQKAQSRAAIIASAAQLIREHGGAGVSVQAAMAGAGLTVGTFYAHFADKAELVDDAFLAAVAESIQLVSNAANGRTGLGALQDVLDAYLSEWHRDNPDSGCPLPAMTGEAAAGDGSLDPSTISFAVNAMTESIRHVASDITASESVALLALMVGGQILARALGDAPASALVLDACRDHGAGLIATDGRRQSR